jgi:hypothetical protein
MWRGTANRVSRLDTDGQVDVCSFGIKRIVSGQVQFSAGLPPAMTCRHDTVR